MAILDDILANRRTEVAGLVPEEARPPLRGFREALSRSNGIGLIAEVKKASPSKGVIVEDFDPVAIAKSYEEGGATCISVLTEGKFFQGSLDDLVAVRAAVGLPILRKDFIVSEAQIRESRSVGADCILLIVAALGLDQLRDFHALAISLGVDVLVEVHSEQEMESANAVGANLIGINNRDLHTFETDIRLTARLALMAHSEALVVSESAIWTREDVLYVQGCGAKAVLVGESLERQEDIAQAVRNLIS